MSQVAQPHEVTLLVGAGILLTFTAGVLNISTFLGPEKKLISHMSGTTVKMGAFFGEGDAKNGCENLAIRRVHRDARLVDELGVYARYDNSAG